MFLSPVDENLIHRVVESCKNKSLTGADGLSMDIVKRVITTIIKPLTHIFNTSIKTGIFPDKLKIANVIRGIKEVHLLINTTLLALVSMDFVKICLRPMP